MMSHSGYDLLILLIVDLGLHRLRLESTIKLFWLTVSFCLVYATLIQSDATGWRVRL